MDFLELLKEQKIQDTIRLALLGAMIFGALFTWVGGTSQDITAFDIKLDWVFGSMLGGFLLMIGYFLFHLSKELYSEYIKDKE